MPCAHPFSGILFPIAGSSPALRSSVNCYWEKLARTVLNFLRGLGGSQIIENMFHLLYSELFSWIFQPP
jgi:hypothetical protein